MRRIFLYSCLILVSLIGHAQLDVDVDSFNKSEKASEDAEGANKNKLFNKAKDFIDKKDRKSVV